MKRVYRTFILIIFVMTVISGCSKSDNVSTDEPITNSANSEMLNQEGTEKAEDAQAITTDENKPEEAVVYEEMKVPESILKNAAIAYQIFPIAYADSDGNGIGDLNGITDKLDYIKNEMHADIIWLNPIQSSPSYHKYDVTDYMSIDLTFGTIEDYQRLIDEAHKRDIKVLMDFVINHTSSSHPWFISAKSGNEKYHDYYVWREKGAENYSSSNGWYAVAGTNEEYFASFWSEMPELNFENPAVRQEIKDIGKYWLDLGVDGFRIDAAKHIYDIAEYPKGTKVLEENLQWFKEFNAYIKQINPEAYLLLEAWDTYNSVSHYLSGADSVFNFDMSNAIVSAVVSENRKNLQGKLSTIYKSYDKVTDQYIDAIFLANHDQDRIMNQIGNEPLKAKLAAAIEFTLPGISWVYYGEEIGMSGVKPDEYIREGMKWSANQEDLPNSRWRSWKYSVDVLSLEEQQLQEDSMFTTYSRLTKLKSEDKVLRYGDYIDNEIGTSFRLFSFFRTFEDKTYLIIHNLHGEGKQLSTNSQLMETVFTTTNSLVQEQSIELEPYGTVVILVDSIEIDVVDETI